VGKVRDLGVTVEDFSRFVMVCSSALDKDVPGVVHIEPTAGPIEFPIPANNWTYGAFVPLHEWKFEDPNADMHSIESDVTDDAEQLRLLQFEVVDDQVIQDPLLWVKWVRFSPARLAEHFRTLIAPSLPKATTGALLAKYKMLEAAIFLFAETRGWETNKHALFLASHLLEELRYQHHLVLDGVSRSAIEKQRLKSKEAGFNPLGRGTDCFALSLAAALDEKDKKETKDKQQKQKGKKEKKDGATCFYCKGTGHYANQCPKNPSATMGGQQAPTVQHGSLSGNGSGGAAPATQVKKH
jgi:hypothetical protein